MFILEGLRCPFSNYFGFIKNDTVETAVSIDGFYNSLCYLIENRINDKNLKMMYQASHGI